jgi:hypothetical protein
MRPLNQAAALRVESGCFWGEGSWGDVMGSWLNGTNLRRIRA